MNIFYLYIVYIFLYSDEVKRLCKVRDEYFVVKDLVFVKENIVLSRNLVIGEYLL